MAFNFDLSGFSRLRMIIFCLFHFSKVMLAIPKITLVDSVDDFLCV